MQNYLKFMLRNWALLSFGLLSVFWGNFGQSFFISWYSEPIQQSLNLSAAEYGSIYSLATLASGLIIIFAGSWIDHISLRRFTVVAALGLMLSALVLYNADQVWLLMLGFFLLRLFGQGLLPHTALTTMARGFELHRGKAISIAYSGVPLGEVLLPISIVALIGIVGWQTSWLYIALTIPFIYIPACLYLLSISNYPLIDKPAVQHSIATQDAPEQPTRGGRQLMLRDVRFWLALPAITAGPFIMTGIFIHQNFIIQHKDWSPLWLANCFVLYGITHWLGSIGSGVLVDRWRAYRLLPYFLLPLLLAMVVSAVFSGLWVAAVLMSAVGITIGAAGPVWGALWAEAYGTRYLGTIRAMTTAIAVLATSLSPVLLGLAIDYGQSVTQLFWQMAVYAAIATGLVCISYRANNIHHES